MNNTEFDFNTKDVYSFLDSRVSGQHNAKIALSNLCFHGLLKKKAYNHFGFDQLEKMNLLLIGSTGVGKTYLLNQVKEFLGTSVLVVDSTTITATGYSKAGGNNIEDIINKYLRKCGEKTEKEILYTLSLSGDKVLYTKDIESIYKEIFIKNLMSGLIIFDEFDKVSAMNDGSSQATYNYQIQDNFLKLIEGHEMDINSKNLTADLRLNYSFTINTSMIQIIFMGAFSDLRKNREEKALKNEIGFGRITEKSKEKIDKKILSEWGFKEELLGRITSIVHLNPLTREDLKNILLNVDLCLFNQYKSIFELQGKEVKLSDELVEISIDKAIESGLGARALKEFYLSNIQNTLFKLPQSNRYFNTLGYKDGEIVIKEDEEEENENDIK